MSANKNVSVCVATSPRPLIEIDANRTGQKATGLLNQAAQNIIRPPLGEEVLNYLRAGAPITKVADRLPGGWPLLATADCAKTMVAIRVQLVKHILNLVDRTV